MSTLFVKAAALGLVLVGGVLAQDVKLNYSLWDNAPFLQYGGRSNSDPSEGWNQSYSGSPVNNYVAGKSLGVDVSSHTTDYTGMFMSLTTIATDVYFLGAGKGTIDLILDDGTSNSQRTAATLNSPTVLKENFPVLAHLAAPSFGNHEFKIKFTEVEDGFLTIQEVIVTVVVGGPGSPNDIDQAKLKYVLDPIGGAVAFGVTASGNWSAVTETCDKSPGADPSECQDGAGAAYLFSSTQGDSLSFQAEPNTSFVALRGPTGADFGKYSVRVDPAPYAGPNPYIITPNNRYNDLDQVMYINSLDPQERYTITVANEEGKKVGLSTAVYLTHPVGEFGSNSNASAVGDHSTDSGSGGGGSGSSKSNLNIGAIAGGAAGGGVALILVCVVGLFLWRRRRENDSHEAAPRVEIDPPVSPMPPPPQAEPYPGPPMSSTYPGSPTPLFTPGANFSPGGYPSHTTMTQSSFSEVNSPLMSQGSQGHRGSVAMMSSTASESDPGQPMRSSYTKAQAQQQAMARAPVVTVEQDMGRVLDTSVPPHDSTVPPLYDPNWADTPPSEAPSSSMPHGAASPVPPGAASSIPPGATNPALSSASSPTFSPM